jgi:UDP-N-acetylglucosamine:LPS N-acetylglucosamine transferase
VVPFVNSEEMAQSLGADSVVSRAGATTILELSALARPTILIPHIFSRKIRVPIELHSFCSSVDQNANPLPAKAAANLS